jgi:hypothetical protein
MRHRDKFENLNTDFNSLRTIFRNCLYILYSYISIKVGTISIDFFREKMTGSVAYRWLTNIVYGSGRRPLWLWPLHYHILNPRWALLTRNERWILQYISQKICNNQPQRTLRLTMTKDSQMLPNQKAPLNGSPMLVRRVPVLHATLCIMHCTYNCVYTTHTYLTHLFILFLMCHDSITPSPSSICRCSRLKQRSISVVSPLQRSAGAKQPLDPTNATYKFHCTGMVLHTQASTSLPCI